MSAKYHALQLHHESPNHCDFYLFLRVHFFSAKKKKFYLFLQMKKKLWKMTWPKKKSFTYFHRRKKKNRKIIIEKKLTRIIDEKQNLKKCFFAFPSGLPYFTHLCHSKFFFPNRTQKSFYSIIIEHNFKISCPTVASRSS